MSDTHARLEQSSAIYEGRVFKVFLDRVVYPDGRRVNMDVVRHPGSVVLIPQPAPDRILLVQQYRYVVDQWLWELPAGTMDAGETPGVTALRECHEETGRVADRARELATFLPSPGFCDEAMHFFLLTELRDRRPDEPAAGQDPDELLKVKEFSVAEAREMVRCGEIVDMKTALGLTLI
jgi:8-oxo-dGTP pyrophosphatase MutT (NUDIX family)